VYTLGINAAYHDCSATLVHDGTVIAAAEEERFTRIKHGKRPVPFSTWQLPFHAMDYCLREAGINLADVDHVAYSYNPSLLLGSHAGNATITLPLEPSAHATSEWLSPWDPLFLSSIVNAPRQLAAGAPHHIKSRFKGVRHDGPYQWHFIEHHLAHEASAFLAAPYDECAVLTMDGRGELATTSYGMYLDRRYRRLKQVNLPHSLGLLYEAVTDHLGFLHSSDEYKVMALASFGKPVYAPLLREVVQYKGCGDYAVKPAEWEKIFGSPRERGTEFTQDHMNIASSLQVVLEETVLQMVEWLHQETGADNL
jgi:carbamoyltransferase